jgi:hypothetical protein
MSLANLKAASAFSFANLTARTVLNPGVIASDEGADQTAIACDTVHELKVELARSLHILFGELAQLLRNIEVLIFGHDTLLLNNLLLEGGLTTSGWR